MVKIGKTETKLRNVHRVCSSCSGTPVTEPIRCISLDCPWLFERKKIEHKAEALSAIEEYVEEVQGGVYPCSDSDSQVHSSIVLFLLLGIPNFYYRSPSCSLTNTKMIKSLVSKVINNPGKKSSLWRTTMIRLGRALCGLTPSSAAPSRQISSAHRLTFGWLRYLLRERFGDPERHQQDSQSASYLNRVEVNAYFQGRTKGLERPCEGAVDTYAVLGGLLVAGTLASLSKTAPDKVRWSGPTEANATTYRRLSDADFTCSANGIPLLQ